MKTIRFGIAFHLSAAISLVLVAGVAPAADVESVFRLGYGWSDNITRVPSSPVDENIQSAGISLDYVEETRRLDVSFRSSFDFLHYQNSTFDDDLVGGAITDVTYWFVDERLNWVLQDNYGQQLIDPLAAATPNNQQNVNFLTTGPTFIQPIGVRNSLVTDLRYSDVNYEDLGLDNTRRSARVAFVRDLSDSSTVSMNGRYRRIEFDNSSGVTPYDIKDVFLRYESDSARNAVTVDAGYSRAEVDGQESDGHLIALSWERTLSTIWTARLTGGSGYTDRADLFRELQNSEGQISRPIDANGSVQPFRFDYVGVAYGLSAPRTSSSISFGGQREDYEFSPNLNRNNLSARASVDRQLTRGFSVHLGVEFVSRDYKTIDRKDDDLRGEASLRYSPGPSWFFNLQAQYIDRESTVSLASFTENRIGLQIGYIPEWGRPAGQ